MRGRLSHRCLVAACVGLGALTAPDGTEGQVRREFVGPGKCTDCHDHKDEKEWSEKRDGDGKGKQHKNSLNQLAEPKADEYAKALRVDVYDVKGTCVKCHATVVRGNADDGISCESCHGAGKDYLKPHQERGAYQASLALGLKDTVKKPETWVRDCVTCHVLGENPGDADLVKVGHSSGADFDLGTKFQPVAFHWTSKYTSNQIASVGNPLRATLLARLAPPKAPPVPPVTPPSPPPQPVDPPPPTEGGKVVPPTPPDTGGPRSDVGKTDLPRLPTPPQPPSPQASSGARGNRSGGGRVTPPLVVALPPALPSQVPDPPTPVMATVVDARASSTPASLVGALQGRLTQLLSDLLTRGVRTPVRLTMPETKTPYRGADAELLRLQEEVIALALEALGTAPPPKAPPPKN